MPAFSGRFIVSTGRSGSTLLSRMIAENRKVLALSEFIASVDNAGRFEEGDLTGRRFAEILTADDDLSALIALHGRQSEEILNAGSGHPDTATGRAPSLVRASLPALTDEPEALFAEVIEFVSRQPAQTIARHYTALFEWLCDRLGRECWLERSGMTIRVFSGLRATFPEARFLHLHRDGMEAALSMHAHPWFRVGIWFDANPPSPAEALAAIRSAGKDPDDTISRLYRDPPPVALYGRHWSNAMAHAYRALVQVPPANYRELRFEDMVQDCRAALTGLAEFLELPDDPGWIDRAVALVGRNLRMRAPELPAEEFAALEEACRPGQILTGRAPSGGLDQTMAALRAGWLEHRKGAD